MKCPAGMQRTTGKGLSAGGIWGLHLALDQLIPRLCALAAQQWAVRKKFWRGHLTRLPQVRRCAPELDQESCNVQLEFRTGSAGGVRTGYTHSSAGSSAATPARRCSPPSRDNSNVVLQVASTAGRICLQICCAWCS